MKITKAEGYKKPNYAVAVAAAMVAVTVSGCGGVDYTDSVDYAGGISMNTPPEEEIQYAGDISIEQIPDVIDYDGGLEMYTEPDVVQLEGETIELVDESDGDEDGKVLDDSNEIESKLYCVPLEDELVLEGGVSIYDPVNEPPMLEGSIEINEP